MPSARSTTGKLQLGLGGGGGDTSQAGCWSLGRRPNAAKAGWLGEEQQPLKWQHMEGAPLSPKVRQAWVDTKANPVEAGREYLRQRQSQEADRGGPGPGISGGPQDVTWTLGAHTGD